MQRKTAETEIVQFRATIDDATQVRIKQIQKLLNASRAGEQSGQSGEFRRSRGGDSSVFPTNVICSDIVLWVYNSQQRRRQMERFYTAEWINKLEPLRIEKGLQIRWRSEVDEALLAMAKENICTGNKSETMRVLIAFAASRKYNLRIAR